MKVAIRKLDTAALGFDAEFERLLHWSEATDQAIEQRVAEILADVQGRGDAAVLEYTARFDRVAAKSVAELEIPRAALRAALDAVSPKQRAALEAAADRVRAYHERQLEACGRSWSYRDADGTVRFVHTLNNTAIATPRILVPFLEQHQTAEGKIKLPSKLRGYMGNKENL